MYTFKNIRLIDPKTRTDTITDITINNGIVWKIGPSDDQGQIIDGRHLVAAPGLIDVHVHFRDPGLTYKEDIITGSSAAKKGGFTSVVMMGNTKPVADNADTIKYVIEKGKQTGIHVYTIANVTKHMQQKELVDFDTLKEAGAIGFSDDGLPILDEKLLYEAMLQAKKLDVPISLHEEDPFFIRQAGVHDGKVSKELSYGGAKRTAEDVMVARDTMLALETGAKLSIQHISSKNSVALVRCAKQLGANVYAEATPHHFTLTDEDVLKYGTLAKMNPPVRENEDREAIIEGLKDGTIDIIATDHAPHSDEEKAQPLEKAPSGIIGLETSLSLGITKLVKENHLTLMELLEKMTINPAKLYQLDEGYIEEGKQADLVIFNPDEEYEVEGFVSKANNSPFLHWQLYGKVKYTICNGQIVYQDESD